MTGVALSDRLPPLPDPILFREDGRAIVPAPIAGTRLAPIANDIRLSWQHWSNDAALLIQHFGLISGGSHATIVTRGRLRTLIADLQSIEEQL